MQTFWNYAIACGRMRQGPPEHGQGHWVALEWSMTTVDVWISGPNGSIDLANGLFGPGTSLWFAAVEALDRGEAEGVAGAAGGDIRLSGRTLKKIADMPDGRSPDLHRSQSSEEQQIRDFWTSIQDDGVYHIGFLEV